MRILIALTILVCTFSISANADDLVLVKGKGVCVCEALFKNLNTMDEFQIACERDKCVEKNDIRRPKWEKLDLRENRDLMKNVLKFMTYGDQFAQLDQVAEKNFESSIRVWLDFDSMYITNADITNTGKAERLLLYSRGRCMISRIYAKALLVVNKDKDQIDVERTGTLLQNAARKFENIKTQALASDYMIYDVFFYKNTTYFDKWNARDWTLSVYETTNNGTKEICRYKYVFAKFLKGRGRR